MGLQLQPVGLELQFNLHSTYSLTEFLAGPNAEVISLLTPSFSLGLSQAIALIGDNSTLVNQMVKACYADASKLNPFLEQNESNYLDFSEYIKEHQPEDLEIFYFRPLIALNNLHVILGNVAWEQAVRDLFTINSNSQGLIIVGSYVDLAAKVCVLEDLQSRFGLFKKVYLKTYAKEELKDFIAYRCREQGLDLSDAGLAYLTQVYQTIDPSSLDLDRTALNILRLCREQQKNPSLLSKQYLQDYPEVFKFTHLNDDLSSFSAQQENEQLGNSKVTAFTDLFTRFKSKQAATQQQLLSREKRRPYTAAFAAGFAQFLRGKYPHLDNYEPEAKLMACLKKEQNFAPTPHQLKVRRLLQQHIQQAHENREQTLFAHAGIDADIFFDSDAEINQDYQRHEDVAPEPALFVPSPPLLNESNELVDALFAESTIEQEQVDLAWQPQEQNALNAPLSRLLRRKKDTKDEQLVNFLQVLDFAE